MLSAVFIVAKAGDTNWPELKAFHGVMSQTFHPSQEGNLKPIRERAGEMVDKAVALSKSKIPADLDAAKINAALDRLVGGTKEVKAMVDSKASDEEISKKLSAVHDTFHEIAGMCEKEGSHEGHEGHDDHKGHDHK